MQQYFIKGNPQSPLVVTDKDTAKHMFSVMRLKEGEQVTLVFDAVVTGHSHAEFPSGNGTGFYENILV